MQQIEASKIFDAVKSDNLASFCTLAKDNLNLSFGRFPILSVCYLFGSKKILKKFEKQLSKISSFNVVEEPFLLYKTFSKVAGRAMRLYFGTKIFVMPIEMLALLHEDQKVKKCFNGFAKTKFTLQNLSTIYGSIFHQNFAIKGNKIVISRQRFSYAQKRFFGRFCGFFAGFAVIFAVFLAIFANTSGLGTSVSPITIISSRQFERLENSSQNFKLAKDISLDGLSLSNFSGSIDGCGKTIKISSVEKSLFQNFSGTLKNVNFQFENLTLNISKSLALLADDCSGKIQDVSVTVNANINQNNNSEEIFFSAIANTNSGTIKNCKVMLDAVSSSDGVHNSYISAIAGTNTGNIVGCELVEGSKIQTTNVDIGAIVAQNLFEGNVSLCKNYASLTQTCNQADWSPNVAGIAIGNVGTISNCFNHGDVTANSTNQSANQNSYVFVGGICAVNNASIVHSQNFGNISSNSASQSVYAGGICAYSQNGSANGTTVNSVVSLCGTTGSINIQKSDDCMSFVGGIAGFFIGEISSCFSISTFTNGHDEATNCFVGTITGATYGQQTFMYVSLYVNIQNSYCLEQSNANKSIAGYYNGFAYFATGELSNVGVSTCGSEDEISSSEVFWNE